MSYFIKDIPQRTFNYCFHRVRQEILPSYIVSQKTLHSAFKHKFLYCKRIQIRESVTISRHSILKLSKRGMTSLCSSSLYVSRERHKHTVTLSHLIKKVHLAFFSYMMELRLIMPWSTVTELHHYLQRNMKVKYRCFNGENAEKSLPGYLTNLVCIDKRKFLALPLPTLGGSITQHHLIFLHGYTYTEALRKGQSI